MLVLHQKNTDKNCDYKRKRSTTAKKTTVAKVIVVFSYIAYRVFYSFFG